MRNIIIYILDRLLDVRIELFKFNEFHNFVAIPDNNTKTHLYLKEPF
jgi:hypothetical protein